MHALFAEPAVQSAIAPLVVGVAVAASLRHRGAEWQALAVSAGLLLAVLLIVGPQLTPLTATRKLVLAALVLPLLVALLSSRPRVAWLAALGGSLAALLWLLWPVLARVGATEAVQLAGVPVIGVLLYLLPSRLLAARPARLAGAGMAAGLGTGVACILGATALYAQLAFAVAAAFSGPILVWLWRRGLPPANTSLPLFCSVIIPLALLGAAATVYASLPPVSLLALGLIPWASLLPLWRGHAALWQGLTAFGLGLLPAVLAIGLAWEAGGGPMY